jgi:hypothetical protein
LIRTPSLAIEERWSALLISAFESRVVFPVAVVFVAFAFAYKGRGSGEPAARVTGS